MNFRDAFDSKGVLPPRSDLPFLPAGTTVELLKSQDRQEGSALNDAYFTLNPIVPNVQAISLGFFAFYNMFPNIASSPNNSNILGITGPEGVPPTIEFVEGRWASGFGTVTNTQVRGDSGNSNLNDVRWYLIRQALGATTEDDAILQGRKVKSGHFFHHSVCRAERVRARDFYVYHVPRCERSYPWYRPRLLPTPSMRARKWAIFRVYNAIFKVLRHVARFDACEAR